MVVIVVKVAKVTVDTTAIIAIVEAAIAANINLFAVFGQPFMEKLRKN